MTDETIFATALEKADPAERAAFLAQACGDDAARRQRLEGLLTAHARAVDFLEHPAAAAPEPDHGATEALSGTADPVVAATRTAGGDNGSSDDEPLTFLSPSARPDSLGRLGHYEVLQVLGRGGFGIVFRAFDEVLQRVVALKVMAPQLAAASPARKRFLREARSSAQVRHENVVQVYEVAEQPLPYLAMEFIPGETLQQRLDRTGPVEPAEVVRVGRQIAEGLAAAHATDLIHRDIKPGNVLLESGQQRVKITDFGLARTADDASITQSGLIAGTPMYMAPEQARGETLDQRADLFSLGSVLYQMAAGRPPFRANGTLAVLKRVAEDTPRPIREVIPETPQWLCDVIAKLHAKDPDERYQSAREVADVLADCEAQLKENAKLKDYSRIPRSKQPVGRQRRSGVLLVVILLVGILGLGAIGSGAVIATLWLLALLHGGARPNVGPEVTSVVATPGSDPAPVVAAKHEPPPAVAPFDAAKARAHQEAWAKHFGAPVEFSNSIGMKLRFIPPGKFTMGSSKEEIGFWLKQTESGWAKTRLDGEGPQHEVEITQPFYMGQTEVTVGQFRQFVTAQGYKTQAEREGGAYRHPPIVARKMDADANWLNPGFAQTDDQPVVCVSWNDAVEFCNWLSKQEGKNYRLPTEAEWEYSSRAGSSGRWCFGDNESELLNYARTGGNSQGHTWPVAGLLENAWGVYDMYGNVEEWCQDVYDPNYYRTSPPKDPPGPDAGWTRVARGGSWADASLFCRSACRSQIHLLERHNNIGFRVVLVVSPPASVGAESGAKDKPAPTTIAPLTDADVRRIAALPAEQQVEEVRKELMRRNPGFDGKMETKIEDGAVTEFRIVTDQVTDIAPIRVFNALRVLNCSGTPTPDWNRGNGMLADLTPLKGMDFSHLLELELNLTKVDDAGLAYFKDCKALKSIQLYQTPVSDAGLAHFKDCKSLADLNLSATKVTDAGLSNFKDCKSLTNIRLNRTKVSDAGLAHFKDYKNLTELWVQDTQVGDAGLAQLKGMPLKVLRIENTGVTDLTPLQGTPLEEIGLTPKNITRGMDILRDMNSLKTIGVKLGQAWPAAEFWERYDKGEFKE